MVNDAVSWLKKIVLFTVGTKRCNHNSVQHNLAFSIKHEFIETCSDVVKNMNTAGNREISASKLN